MITPHFLKRCVQLFSFCFLFGFSLLTFAGGPDLAAHPSPLHAHAWSLSFYSGVAPTSLTRRTRNIRFGINPAFTSTGVLRAIGDDNFFDEQFGLPVIYGFLIGYAFNNNVEGGIELEGVHASGQVYTRSTSVGLVSQQFSNYNSYAAYLTLAYYFNTLFHWGYGRLFPFIGIKTGLMHRARVNILSDSVDGMPTSFDGSEQTPFYVNDSVLSSGVFLGLLYNLSQTTSIFLRGGVTASGGLHGKVFAFKTVVGRPVRAWSLTDSGTMLSYPVELGIRVVFF